MFQFLSTLFRRSREIEAKLSPTPNSSFGGKGEIEIETWSDGAGKFEASLQHCELPDGAEVEVFCGEYRITSLIVSRGHAKKVVTKPADAGGFDESLAVVGDEGSFRHLGETICRGTFRPD